MTKEIKQTKDIQTVIDELATKGVEGPLNDMADFTQEQVDHIVHSQVAAIAALDRHHVSWQNWLLTEQVVVFMKTKP